MEVFESKSDVAVHVRPGEILTFSACAGLLIGVTEGAGLLLLQSLGWLSWARLQLHVTVEIIAISAAFNFVLFGLGGGMWALASIFLRPLGELRFVLIVLASFAFFDWLSLPGYLQDIGALSLAVALSVLMVRKSKGRIRGALSFVRRSVPWVFAGGMLTIVGIPGGLWAAAEITVATLPSPPTGAPNLLIVVMDTVRAQQVSAYGYHRETTPHLDRLSRKGVLFEHAFTAAPWSPPAHASLLTGRYPFEHRVDWNYPLDDRAPTLPEVLLSRGYVTGAFSGNKWWFNPAVGFDRGFIYFDSLYHTPGDAISRTLYGRFLNRYVLPRVYRVIGWWPMKAEKVTQKALKWVEAKRGRPFLLFVNFIDSHAPYVAPDQFRNRFVPDGKPKPCQITRDTVEQLKITAEMVRRCTDAYDGAIAYVDHNLGLLVAGLEQRGLLNNTLIVVTSDHGELLYEHGLSEHRNSLYLPEIRVPLVLSWPSRIPMGTRITTPVSTASLPQTILDVLGEDRQDEFPVPSLRPLWENPAASWDWPWPLSQLGHYPFLKNNSIPSKHGSLHSLVTPRWHYIVHEKLGEELYDWTRDPEEERNLAKTPEGQAVTREMAARLERLLGRRLHVQGQGQN